MTDADEVRIHNILGAIWHRNRINRKIRIRILDHFWLRLNVVAEACTLSAESSFICKFLVYYLWSRLSLCVLYVHACLTFIFILTFKFFCAGGIGSF